MHVLCVVIFFMFFQCSFVIFRFFCFIRSRSQINFYIYYFSIAICNIQIFRFYFIKIFVGYLIVYFWCFYCIKYLNGKKKIEKNKEYCASAKAALKKFALKKQLNKSVNGSQTLFFFFFER